MDTTFWNLFWTTGMPEAWLMSRNGEGPMPSTPLGGGQGLSGPLADFPASLISNVPGSPKNLY